MALKISAFTLFLALITLTSRAQDTIPLYSDVLAKQALALRPQTTRPSLGLELIPVGWAVWSGRQSDSPGTYAYPVAITLYFPRPGVVSGRERTLYVGAGYKSYGGTLQRNIYQSGGSVHVRVGIETTEKGVILGYGGILSGWSGQGSFIFKGPYFGDYQESVGQLGGWAIGGEGHVGGVIPFSNRLSLRMAVRGSALMKLPGRYNLSTPYLSGIDWQTSNQFGLCISLQTNLVFRL